MGVHLNGQLLFCRVVHLVVMHDHEGGYTAAGVIGCLLLRGEIVQQQWLAGYRLPRIGTASCCQQPADQG